MKKANTKKLFSLVCAILAFVLVFSLAACGKKGGNDTPATLELDKTTISLKVGESGTVSVKSATTETIVWSSSDESKATVTGSGTGNKLATITAVAEGEVTITAKAGDTTAACKVTITAADPSEDPDDNPSENPDENPDSGDNENPDNGNEEPETLTLKVGNRDVADGTEDLFIDDTLTLTATGSKGSTIVWETSDSEIATVADGVVTAVAAGDATITAKIGTELTKSVTVHCSAATNVAFGDEAGLENGWAYWSGDGNAVVSSCQTNDNLDALKIKYTWSSGQFYSVQLFYKDKLAAKKHDIDLVIVSSIDCGITVNGEVQELAVGENVVSVSDYTGSTVSVQFGVSDTSCAIGTDVEFIFKNIKVTSKASTELVAPSFALDSDKVITITDEENDAENVEKYELGFFANADDVKPAYKLNVANGDTLNLSTIGTGTYTLKLRAVNSSTDVINSGWSTAMATLEWSNSKTPLDYKANDAITDADKDTWFMWYQNWDPTVTYTECYIQNNDIHWLGIENNVSAFWSVQLFYKGTQAFTKLTMTVNSTNGGKITINGTVFELEAGVDKDIEIAAGQDLSIQFGADADGTSSNLSGDVVLSNITFTYVE